MARSRTSFSRIAIFACPLGTCAQEAQLPSAAKASRQYSCRTSPGQQIADISRPSQDVQLSSSPPAVHYGFAPTRADSSHRQLRPWQHTSPVGPRKLEHSQSEEGKTETASDRPGA